MRVCMCYMGDAYLANADIRKYTCLLLAVIRDRPFNLKGGGIMVFCFVQNLFFGQHES
jgi:hypothetical protein